MSPVSPTSPDQPRARKRVAIAPLRRARFAIIVLAACAACSTPFASVTTAAETPERPIDSVSRRVVKIFGAGGIKGLYAYSTGFLVSPNGHLVTVWSHVLDSDSVTVVLSDGRRMEGKILGAEPQLDLAVLKIEGEDFPYFNLDDSVTAP